MSEACIVLTTCASRADAEVLASKLVEAQLAGCVQLVDITSLYRWEGLVNKDTETLLLVKALAARYDEVEAFIRANHAYQVPEVVMIPVERISEAYLRWLVSVSR